VDLPWFGDLHALAEEAAAARNRSLYLQFEVVALDDHAFFAAFDEHASHDDGRLRAELNSTLRAFSFKPREERLVTSPASAEALARFQRERVLAFYVFTNHRMYVRATRPTLLETADDEYVTSLLAHARARATPRRSAGSTTSSSTA
jgi:hypothetical protein